MARNMHRPVLSAEGNTIWKKPGLNERTQRGSLINISNCLVTERCSATKNSIYTCMLLQVCSLYVVLTSRSLSKILLREFKGGAMMQTNCIIAFVNQSKLTNFLSYMYCIISHSASWSKFLKNILFMRHFYISQSIVMFLFFQY